MSIALVIAEHRDAIDLLPWAIDLALIRKTDLLLIYLTRHASQKQRMELGPDDNSDWGEYGEAARLLEAAQGRAASPESDVSDSAASDGFNFRLVSLQHPQPVAAVCEELRHSAAKTLLIRRESSHSQSLDKASIKELISEVTCELIQIRTGTDAGPPQSFMVPMGPGTQSENALRLAADLSARHDAKLTALYVEPDVDEYAEQVGNKILNRRIDRAFVDGSVQSELRVVLDDKVHRGIRSVLDDYDAVVLGIRHHGRMHRWLIRALSEELLSQDNGPTIIAVRSATPLTGRIVRSLDRTLREGVPQLERNQRIAIVERIQSSSKWDFDFVALICLSTLIAAGGLIQNSAAVVIGAMLVAPLMTPLLGAGLSLVQGNLVLLRNALQTVSRGFMLAVALSYCVGWIWPGMATTSEMAQRGAPNVLDLVVAFISGIAAAYAIGRPNLLSALPGVAIAAALVPPTATVGLGLAMGQWNLALGAALLFLTNIVAIVLGTACSFLAVGVRGSHSHSAFQSRTLRIAVGLIAVLLVLGIYESLPKRHVPAAVEAQISKVLQAENIQLVSLQWLERNRRPTIVVSVESQSPIPASVPDQLAEMIRESVAEPVRIRFETRLVTEMDVR